MTPDPFKPYRTGFYAMAFGLIVLICGTFLHGYLASSFYRGSADTLMTELDMTALSIAPSGSPLRSPDLFLFNRSDRFGPETAIPVPDPAKLLLASPEADRKGFP